MEKIIWITPFSFIETDIYIIPYLSKLYKIDWHLIISKNETNIYENEIKLIIQNNKNISLSSLHLYERPYSFSTLAAIYKFLKQLINKKDLLYTSLCCFPYYMPLVRLFCDPNYTIVAVHNVVTPKGASSYRLTKWYTNFVLASFLNFQTFSNSQHKALIRMKPNKTVFKVSFALKDYGLPSTKPNEDITFLSFGKIRDYKRIDVLILAAQNAYEIIKQPFKIIIAGSCKDWEKYQQLIRYPFLFDLIIRNISNDEIPNIFGSSHYFVTPYQDIAQSGSLIVAINYNKPIIASDLESLNDYVIDEITGFRIKPADINDLTDKLCFVIKNHDTIYPYLSNNVLKMKEDHFSITKIVNQYTAFFNKIICLKNEKNYKIK